MCKGESLCTVYCRGHILFPNFYFVFQVNDFLSGKAPLNLTMRLGDHMMLIQLQLSTVTPNSSGSSGGSNSAKRSSISKSVPSASAKHVSKPIASDPLASLTSIVNKSIEESCSSSPNKLKDKQSPVKRTGILALMDSNNVEVRPRVGEESIQNADETIPSIDSSSKNNVTDNVNSASASGTGMDVDSAGVKSSSVGDNAVKASPCKCDVSTNPSRTVGTPAKPTLDTRALAEASRNLTQTLKQLSSEVLTSKADPIEVKYLLLL